MYPSDRQALSAFCDVPFAKVVGGSGKFPIFAARFRPSMSRICQITGKKMMVGHHVSHSNIKTKRTFAPNLQDRKYYLPEEKKWVTLRVSTNGMRTINKIGLSEALKRAKAKGYYNG
jgi:large subunit ribosomal protein L28